MVKRISTLAATTWLAAATFAGGMADTAHALSLQEALVHTYNHNPELKAARRELESNHERMAQSFSNWRPNANFAWEKGKDKVEFQGQNGSYQDSENRTWSVSQPLFRGGGSFANYKSVRATIKGQQEAYFQAEQDTLLDGAVTYVDVIRARELVKLTGKNEKVLNKHQAATDDRFSVGEVTKTDVSQAKSRLARSLSDRVQAEGALVSAVAAFERVVRTQPSEAMVMNLPTIKLPETEEEAIQLADAHNPTLQQAKDNVKAAKYNVWEQRSNVLPTVDFVASKRHSEGGVSFNGQNFDNESLVFSVNVPLYQAGRVYSIARQAARQREQRKELFYDTENRVRESVISAWQRLLTSRAVIAASEENISAGNTALDGVQQEHLHGARTTLDVLDAEQELFEAEVELVTAQRNEAVAVFNLASLLGRFTAKELELDVKLYEPEDHYDTMKWRVIGF